MITFGPIPWVAMKMGDCYHNNGISFHAIDHAVGEPSQYAPSKPRLYFWAGQGESSQSSYCPIQIVEKIPPQTIRLLIIPGNGIGDFLIG
jgi:hypothetical protein